MYDVRPEHYTTVIREMIKHEDLAAGSNSACVFWLRRRVGGGGLRFERPLHNSGLS